MTGSAGSAGSAGRVIAGTARGIRLSAPGPTTRPLGDRVKQTTFAILEPRLRGAAFLDLYAGSGAAGIEALSRGAVTAVFVERDEAALAAIRSNLARADFGPDRARVIRSDVPGWLASTIGAFDIVFLDPPYGDPALLAILERLGRGDHIVPGGIVVAKHFWRDAPPAVVGLLASTRERRFGETGLTFYDAGRRRDAGSPDVAGGGGEDG